MTKWELLTNESARQIWDENLIRFDGYSPFQMYAWGEYNRALGWQPVYLAARSATGEITAMMLGLLRRYPLSVGLLWCAGGPVGDLSALGADFYQTLTEATKLKRLYCRFRCDRERNIKDVLALNRQGWMRSWFIMHSSWTMELDLAVDDAQLLSNCSPNWRRNLRLAQKNNLQIRFWENPDIDELAAVYDEMQTRKNLPEQFSRDELKNLFEQAGKNFVCYCAEDENGKLVALRGCLIVGERAIDHLAATTLRGRELRASFPVFWKLLQASRERGVRFYDLSGIDPHKNPGVYTFKKETGARPVESLGEWDWATSDWLRWFGNWAIRRKSGQPQKLKKVRTNEKSESKPALASQSL